MSGGDARGGGADAAADPLGSGVRGLVLRGDNLAAAALLPDGCADLVYIDPPFNTGVRRRLQRLRTTQDEDGDRTGFGGRRYLTVRLGASSYVDVFDDYLAFLEPRLLECRRLLAAHGTLYLHVDYREAHYCKVLLDVLFGRACFVNELIWAYDFGGRPVDRWPAKHDTILVYARDESRRYFDTAEVERIPYMAPGLVGPDKAARGKLPTDTWWHSIVPTSGRERTGYPTQKPLPILRRIVAASCPPGGLVVDLFAGSGTTGAAAHELGRRFLLVDDNPEAIAVMRGRLGSLGGVVFDTVPAAASDGAGAEGSRAAGNG